MIRYSDEILHTTLLVVGGGPSGLMCALAAARRGCSVTLIERAGFLGGCATQSLALPLMSFHANGEKVVCGFADELMDRIASLGGTSGHQTDPITGTCTVTPISSEVYKYAAQELLLEAGVRILLHTELIDLDVNARNVTKAYVRTPSGNYIIEADYYADATGSAEVSMLAGVPTKVGRDADGLPQPMSLLFKLQNVDCAQLRAYIAEHPESVTLGEGATLESFLASPRLCISGFFSHVSEAQRRGTFSQYRDRVLVFETDRPGEMSVNMSRVVGKNPVSGFEMGEAELIGRRQVFEILAFLREYIPGFSHAWLGETASQIGVRESRRIVTPFVLTAQDILESRPQPDSVALGCWPIDIHSPDGKRLQCQTILPGGYYQIPYRCMLPAEIDNLIVTGRIISTTHEAFASVRVAPTCFALGQAAGTAAALAAQNHLPMRGISVPELQKLLRDDGQRID